MSDLAYTVMITAVVLGLVLVAHGAQWCFDVTRARRTRTPRRTAAPRAPSPSR